MFPPRFVLALGLLFYTTSAFAYGPAGHETVGNLAAHYLQTTNAETHVRELLLPDETLAKAATWADRAKFPDTYLTPEMKEFVANNPDHHTFHYCDVPFQEAAYREGGTGTNAADIVHTMNLCIRILQSPGAAPTNPRKITKRVALLLLAHLVGDLHQPLHVGCSYVNAKNQFVDPDQGGKGQSDNGGNAFRITGSLALHGLWDTPAVKNARDKAKGQDFVAYLLAKNPPRLDWKTSGPLAAWPQRWATETLHLSGPAYAGLVLSNRHQVPADGQKPAHDEWTVTLPPNYLEKSGAVVEVELAKAGYRLAELLKAIWP